jgi:Holliday junction resolvase RusA-like endonuclease
MTTLSDMTDPMTHTFTVSGRPKSKDRPRLGRRRKVFTPEATINAEEAIARAYLESDGPIFDGPVHVDVAYTFKGQTITITEAPDEPLTLWQSDIDNLLKTTLDGLQRSGGAFADDKQVRRISAHKGK